MASRMIWPIKVFRGKQPYDTVSKTLLVPHTFGEDDSVLLVELQLGQSPRGRHEGGRRRLQRQVRLRQHRDDLADHPHGRAQGRRADLRAVPQRRTAA